jgi:predicted HAD superfamily Cof-like phosphohydrolase
MNLAQVRQFQKKYGFHTQDYPGHPPEEVVKFRQALLEEEVAEYNQAVENRDLVEIADALGDMVYVIFGTALAYGIDLDAVFAEIHRSNMDKEVGQLKPVKGPTWIPPRISQVLQTSIVLSEPPWVPPENTAIE